MKIGKFLGRVLLASQFVYGGYGAAKDPGTRPDAAAKIGLPNPELMVRLNGGAMVLGGVLLALGIKPKWAAALLAGCLIPTTYAGHQFWAADNPQAVAGQKIQFCKNASMLGGLVLVLAEQ